MKNATHHHCYICFGCRYGFRGFYEGQQPMVLTENNVVDIQLQGGTILVSAFQQRNLTSSLFSG